MDDRSVVVAAFPVHVAVLEFFRRRLAHVDDVDVEMQVLARHRMVEVDVDHAHADGMKVVHNGGDGVDGMDSLLPAGGAADALQRP